VIRIEAEMVLDVSVVVGKETTIPTIKTETNVSCVPVVSVMHISYQLYPELPAPICVLVKAKFDWGMALSSFKEINHYFYNFRVYSVAAIL
jgi:hypothetical protein